MIEVQSKTIGDIKFDFKSKETKCQYSLKSLEDLV